MPSLWKSLTAAFSIGPESLDSPAVQVGTKPKAGLKTEPTTQQLAQPVDQLANLQAERVALDNRARQSLQSLQGLERDKQALVARYAEARLNGAEVERRAIERQFESLQQRIRLEELCHTQMTKAIQVRFVAEQMLQTQAWQKDVAGPQGLLTDIDTLTKQLEGMVATQRLDGKKLDDLLDSMATVAMQDTLAQDGAQARTREQLNALTEAEVQRTQDLALGPLEQAAQALERTAEPAN